MTNSSASGQFLESGNGLPQAVAPGGAPFAA